MPLVGISGKFKMDFTNIEKIAPGHWLNSQLSIASHYGRITIQGRMYIIDPLDNYLVREDIYKAEMKDRKRVAAEKEKWMAAQQHILELF